MLHFLNYDIILEHLTHMFTKKMIFMKMNFTVWLYDLSNYFVIDMFITAANFSFIISYW